MKNVIKFLGIIAIVAIVGLSMASCATATTIGGAEGPHGLFTGNGAAGSVTAGATEIASYKTILGLFDAGYNDYADAVKAAEASGKQVISVTKFYIVLFITTAYAK